MKKFTRPLTLSKLLMSAFALLICAGTTYAQSEIKVQFGLESKAYFKERNVPLNTNSAVNTSGTAKPSEKLYKFFCINDNYEMVIMRFFEKHNTLWNKYCGETPENQRSERSFKRYVHENDQYHFARAASLAPTIYFDFIGKNTKYVLESITIQTLNFDEYSGGGFSADESTYDIKLKHEIGKYKYPIVDNKLVFNGTGRAELRFWSDNYYKSMGMAPMGCYTIKVIFNFLSDGKKVSVVTDTFKIDV